MTDTTPSYPINFVAKVTGLSTHTIRMWERRYAVVSPARSKSGHRSYSDRDVERLKLLRRVVNGGHSIGTVAALSDDELRAVAREDGTTPPVRTPRDTTPPTASMAVQRLLDEACAAIGAMERDSLDRILTSAALELPPFHVIEQVVIPVLHWVGDEWRGGGLRIAHEHLATATVRAHIERLRRVLRRTAGAPRITVTTPAGQEHEMGALIFAYVAALEGWQEFYFGPDMPPGEIAKAVVSTGSTALALSITTDGAPGDTLVQLIDLMECVPRGVSVMAGGAGTRLLQDDLARLGIVCFDDIAAGRDHLASLRGT